MPQKPQAFQRLTMQTHYCFLEHISVHHEHNPLHRLHSAPQGDDLRRSVCIELQWLVARCGESPPHLHQKVMSASQKILNDVLAGVLAVADSAWSYL